ncbi:MAG: hypothetical protein ACLU8W_00810 [Clostridia bacterium]
MKVKIILCGGLACLCFLSGCGGRTEERESSDLIDGENFSVDEQPQTSETMLTETQTVTIEETRTELIEESSIASLGAKAKPGDVFYDVDGIKVSLVGLQEDEYNKYIVWQAENNTDYKAQIGLWYASVNDYMFEVFQSGMDNTVSPHKKGKVVIELDKQKLEEEGLLDIETVSGELSIILEGASSDPVFTDEYIKTPIEMSFD